MRSADYIADKFVETVRPLVDEVADKLVEKLNQQLQTDNITARLKVDADSGKIYIQIICSFFNL